MKQLLLIPALLAGTLLLAEQKNYEISPMIGFDYHEPSLGFKDDGYFLGGLEFQINNVSSKIKPEFSIFYSQDVDYTTGQSSDILRGAVNGVYDFEDMNNFTPFVKAGLGVEDVQTETVENKNALFLDVGVGAKINFTQNLALKLEAIYLGKVATHNEGILDHNLITLVGLTYAFGETTQKAAEPVKTEPAKVEPAPEPVAAPVVVAPVVVDGDDDKDGILNSKDTCPHTKAGVKVDAQGCTLDSDEDGVLNTNDICPNTPTGEAVNSDGCPQTVALQINFENDSDAIKGESEARIQKYADFLIKHTNYTAKIIGYTDSRGSQKYNQKLSQRRADAVVAVLIAKGVNKNQLSALGRGEDNPIATNETAQGRAKNRRIEAELTRN